MLSRVCRGACRAGRSHVGGAVQRCRDVAVKPRAVGRVAHKSRPVGASRLHVHVSYDHPVGSGARQGSTRHRRSTERRPPAPPGWSIGHTGARRVPSPKTRDRDDEIIHRPPTRLRATSAVGSHRDPRPEICLSRCYLALINSQPSRRKRGRLHATDSSQPGTNPRALQPPRRIRLFELFRASAGSAALVRPPWPPGRGRNRSGAVEYPCTPGEQSDRNKSRNHPHAAARAHPDRLSRIPVIQRTRSRRSLAQLYSTRAPEWAHQTTDPSTVGSVAEQRGRFSAQRAASRQGS